MKKYQVLEDGKPCDCYNFPVHASWNKSVHSSFEEAEAYASKWLGCFSGICIPVNTPVDYAYGSTIEIREIEVNEEMVKAMIPISFDF